MRVLIVKMSALGDIVHALPVLDYLHQTVKGIEIDWVVEESFKDLLTGNPLISYLHTVQFKSWRKQPLAPETWREMGQIRSALQSRAYDLVFDLQGNIKSGSVAWLTGCPRRYGFDADGVREGLNVYCTTNQIPLRRQDHHITDRSLRMVSVPFGKDYGGAQYSANIWTSPEDDAAAELFLATLADGLVFLVHHGTTWQTKHWHEEGWITLGQLLMKEFPEATMLLSWGGESEQKTAQRIAAGIGQQARLLPRLTLKGFAAMLKKVDLVLGGDTGPIHMAAAVGTPTVSLFRVTDGKRNGPRGELNRVVQSPLPCTCCLKKECDKDLECRQSITADMMFQQCLALLDGGRQP
jgi:heptosyltransferase I